MYYLYNMENFKNHIKPFDFLKKKQPTDPMAPKYVKPDGTKIIEQDCEIGKAVYQISPDATLVCHTYDHDNSLVLDYIRKLNIEIGRTYDEYGRITFEFESVYDEHNKLAKRTETQIFYHDNNNKSKEIIIKYPGEFKYEKHYDENGKFTESVEIRGAVKTWFDPNGKPFKRETDKGSGGIVTENL